MPATIPLKEASATRPMASTVASVESDASAVLVTTVSAIAPIRAGRALSSICFSPVNLTVAETITPMAFLRVSSSNPAAGESKLATKAPATLGATKFKSC